MFPQLLTGERDPLCTLTTARYHRDTNAPLSYRGQTPRESWRKAPPVGPSR